MGNRYPGHSLVGLLAMAANASPAESPKRPTCPARGSRAFPVWPDTGRRSSVPAASPRELLAQWSPETEAVLALPEVQDRMKALGVARTPVAPEELAASMARHARQYSEPVKAAGIALQ